MLSIFASAYFCMYLSFFRKNDNTMNTVAVMGLDYSMYQFEKFLMDNIVGCRTSKSTYVLSIK